MMDYQAFLEAKATLAVSGGVEIADADIHPILKPHQRAIVQWAVRGGRRAIFASFGLGKTLMQLESVRLTLRHAGGRGLIVVPLGVRQEFKRDATMLGVDVEFIRRLEEADICERQVGHEGSERRPIYLTNYETVRDGKMDPRAFSVISLDEANVLRGLGGTKTFREFMRLYEGTSSYRFVATATPDPNDYIELLAYAAFLDVTDVGQAKTRFFKRDSTKADALTLHPHKEHEFWLWVSSWAIFAQRPSDLGFSDEGYVLPEMTVRWHEIETNHARAGAERDGQQRMFHDVTYGVSEAAREKRGSLEARIGKLMELRAEDPGAHRILWHDLEAERKTIEAAIPGVVSVYGRQDLDAREQAIIDFSDGTIQELARRKRLQLPAALRLGDLPRHWLQVQRCHSGDSSRPPLPPVAAGAHRSDLHRSGAAHPGDPRSEVGASCRAGRHHERADPGAWARGRVAAGRAPAFDRL